MKRNRTPQEKKILSYARDRRNGVAESRALARKSIAKRKRDANQALRRQVHTTLAAATRQAESDMTDAFVARTGRKSWKKKPDVSLSTYLTAKIRSRPRRGQSSKAGPSGLLTAGRAKAAKRPGRL